ncbi:hypothetical protein WA577_000202, partial [Blastocystis sp. JDR]
MDYAYSTQKLNWMFSKEDLNRMRGEAHSRIVKSIILKRKNHDAAQNATNLEKSTNPTTSVGTPERPEKRASAGTPSVKMEHPTPDLNPALATVSVPQEEIDKYPTLEEEWALLSSYLSKLFDSYPDHPDKCINYRSIQYYAATYVKRFYLTRSILQYDPKLVCASSMLLAIKADNYKPLDAGVLANDMDVKKEAIIEMEQKLLFALKYQMVIHTPYRMSRIIDAVLLDMARSESFKSILAEDVLHQLQTTADSLISTVGSTDVDLVIDPYYIALYAYYNALKQLNDGTAVFAELVERLCQGNGIVPITGNDFVPLETLVKRIEQVTVAVNDFKLMLSKVDTKAAKKKWRHMREYDRVLPKPIHKKTDDGSSLAHSQGIVESIGGQSNQSESSFVTYKQETP